MKVVLILLRTLVLALPELLTLLKKTEKDNETTKTTEESNPAKTDDKSEIKKPAENTNISDSLSDIFP